MSKEEGNGVVTEKRERKCGKDWGFMRVKYISYLIVDVDKTYHYYHWDIENEIHVWEKVGWLF